jgi:hypothetical protein
MGEYLGQEDAFAKVRMGCAEGKPIPQIPNLYQLSH